MVIDAHNHIGVELLNYATGSHPYAQSFEDLRAKAAGSSVSHWIVFPFVSYAKGPLPMMPDSPIELSRVPYAHANEGLLREIEMMPSDVAAHAWPFVIVDPEREPEAQAKVLRTLKQRHRIYGIKIQGTIIQSKVISLLQKATCLLDLAEEWNVPMLIHSSIHPDDVWSQCSDILKVAEARPGVRFVLAHSCRFDRASLDRVAELPNTWFDCSAHRIHCELACKDSPAIAVEGARFPSDYRDPSQVLNDLADAYPNKLIWGTDSPYYSWISAKGDVPEKLISTYLDEWQCVDSLAAAQQRKITLDNTLNWLGLNENSI